MSTTTTVPRQDCTDDPSGNVTRSLLGWLALAGPVYLVTSVTQGVLRRGFDFTRHDWSLLAIGPHGWIQMLNLILTGAMLIAGAIGVGRALAARPSRRAERALPRLLGGYGVGLALAGIFTADPSDGFPVGTPAGHTTTVSWHGLLHLITGGLGFGCLVAACLIAASVHRHRRQFGRAWIDTAVGVIFGLSFLGIASGSGTPPIVLGFTAGVVISFVWLTALAVELYRGTRTTR